MIHKKNPTIIMQSGIIATRQFLLKFLITKITARIKRIGWRIKRINSINVIRDVSKGMRRFKNITKTVTARRVVKPFAL